MSWRWMLLLFLLFWQCPLSAQETPEPGSSSTDGGLEQREGDKDGVVEPVATEEPTSSDGVDASPATDAAEVGTEQGGAVQDGMAAELPEQLPPGPPLNPEPQPFPSGSAEPVSDAGFEAWLYLRISLGFAGSASEEGKLDGALQWKAEDSSTRLSLQGCVGFDAIIERFFMLGVRV
ncbi:MAG: hypothetical protein RBU37_22875, partial [Myxococcota bacterium]|nr:hypothetical protein [Myxococcota bacterium]